VDATGDLDQVPNGLLDVVVPPTIAGAVPSVDAAGDLDQVPNGLGELLHRGHRGKIWVFRDNERQVFKGLPAGNLSRVAFDRLADSGQQLQRSLTDRGLPIRLCWPVDVQVFDGAVGTLAPRIEQRFFDHTGPQAVARTLDWALVGRSRDVGDRVRLDLVRLVGELLAEMHPRSLVHGDLRLSNFTFTANGPELCAHDFESTRRLGDPPLGRPEAKPGAPATLDGDRYGFAKLACGLLARDRRDQRPGDANQGLDRDQLRRLVPLAHRALRGDGMRPQVEEWLEILGPVPDANPPLTQRGARAGT
jgi:hypothetical protein